MGVYYNKDENIFINCDLSEYDLSRSNYYPVNLIKLELQVTNERKEYFWMLESCGTELISKSRSINGISSGTSRYVKIISKKKVESKEEIDAYYDYVRCMVEDVSKRYKKTRYRNDGYWRQDDHFDKKIYSYVENCNLPLCEFIRFNSYDESIEKVKKQQKSKTYSNDIFSIGAWYCSGYSFPNHRDVYFYPFVSNVFIFSNYDYSYEKLYEDYSRKFNKNDIVVQGSFGSMFRDLTVTLNYYDICDVPKELVNLKDIKATYEELEKVRAYSKALMSGKTNEIEELKNKILREAIEQLVLEFKTRDDKLNGQIVEKDKMVDEFKTTVNELLKRMDTLAEDSRFASLKEEFFKEIGITTQSNYLEFKKMLEKAINDIDKKRQETISLGNKLTDTINQTKKQVEVEVDKIVNSGNTNLEKVRRSLSELEKKKEQLIKDITEEVVREVIKRNPVQEININLGDEDIKRKVKGIYHEAFKEVLQLIHLRTPVFLVGPAGCGKNVMLKQAAKVLDLQFYYINDAREKYDLLGFVDANGKYQETQFYKAFTKGGLLMIDELDSADASVLLLLNSALGTGDDFYMTFPDGNQYQAHPDFYLVAAANTFGTGANQTYNGRNQLDGASLNRFLAVEVDYDTNIERTLVNNPDILPLYWEVRRIIRENEINYVVSTRNILNADKYLSSRAFSLDKIFKWTLVGSMTEFDLGVIISNIKTTDRYSTSFIDYVKRNYKIQEAKEKTKTKTRTRNDGYDREDDEDDDDYGYGRGRYGGYGYV